MSVEIVAKKFPPIVFVEAVPIREQIIAILEANPGGVLMVNIEQSVSGSASTVYRETKALAESGVIVKGLAKNQNGRTVTAYRLKT